MDYHTRKQFQALIIALVAMVLVIGLGWVVTRTIDTIVDIQVQAEFKG